MFKDKNNEKFIELKELCSIIKATDIRTATNWCKEKKISIFIIGKKKMAYRFLVDAELDKGIISIFKERYPESWDKLYQCYLNNESLEYVMALETNMEKMGYLDINPKSDFAKKLLNG